MSRLVARLAEPGEEEVLSSDASLLRPDLGPAPLPGHLALSWNYLAFEATDGSVQLWIALKEVEEVAVHDAAPWMSGRSAPALRLCTMKHKLMFVNIPEDQLEKLQQAVSATWEAAIERHVAFVSSAYAAPVQEPTNLSELLLNFRSRNAGRQVNAPPVPLIDMDVCKLRLKKGAWLHGSFLLFAHFGAFVADSSDLAIRLVLPYSDIIVPVSVDRSGGSFTVCTRLLNRAIEIAFTPASRAAEMAQILDRSAALSIAPSLPAPTSADVRPGLFVLIDTDHVAKGWLERNASRLELWSRYVSINGLGTDMLRTPQLSSLIRGGLPDELRGGLWWALSGAALDYHANFEQSLAAGCTERAKREIEQDVRRTLPSHPLFQTEDGLNSLRRVLLAYAARNPALGYCQSMNFLAAMLLLYLPEARAFAVLARLCEQLLPHYHSPEMVGAKLDLHVLDQLLGERLPVLRSHITSTHLSTSIISLSWFLCLFCQTLPLEGALYALDVLLCEGERCTILFELSLALFAQLEAPLLASSEPDALLRLFRTSSLPDLLTSLDAAFVPFERVAHLRASLRPSLVHSIQKDLRARALSRHRAAQKTTLRRPPRGIAQRTSTVVVPAEFPQRQKAALRIQGVWRGRAHRLSVAFPVVSQLRSRVAALHDLITSETDYLSSLDTVLSVFLSPLRVSPLPQPARTAQQVLFAPLEALLCAHRPFTLALRTAIRDKSSARLDLASALAALGAALPRYVEYVRSFGSHRLALETLRADEIAGPCLTAAFRAHATVLQHRDLDYLLLLPLHRPARLRHLLGELLRVRGSTDPLAADLFAAIEALDGTLSVLAEAENAAAEDERTGRMVSRIKGCTRTLTALRLQRNGEAKGPKGELHLFLFSDLVLVCKPDGSGFFECTAQCDLRASIALSVQSDASALLLFDNRTATAIATLFLATPAERDSWLSAFWDAALALRSAPPAATSHTANSAPASSVASPSTSLASSLSAPSSQSTSNVNASVSSPAASRPARALAALQSLWRQRSGAEEPDEPGQLPSTSLYSSDIVARTRAGSPPLPAPIAPAPSSTSPSATASSSLSSSLTALPSVPAQSVTARLFSSLTSRPLSPPADPTTPTVRAERTLSLPGSPAAVSPSHSPSPTPDTRSPSSSFSAPSASAHVRHTPPQRPLPARPPRRSTEGEPPPP